MKVRVSTALVVVCAMATAILIAAGTGGVVKAHADKIYGPNCGSGTAVGLIAAKSLSHTSAPSVWTAKWEQQCGGGKQMEWEIQLNKNPLTGGTWQDATDRVFVTPSDKANVDYIVTQTDTSFTCSNNWGYRLRVYDVDSSSTTNYIMGQC